MKMSNIFAETCLIVLTLTGIGSIGAKFLTASEYSEHPTSTRVIKTGSVFVPKPPVRCTSFGKLHDLDSRILADIDFCRSARIPKSVWHTQNL